MQPVHDAIGPGTQKRRPLKNVCEDIKELFPGFTHGKHGVGSVPVQKKGLREQTQIPVSQKKNKDRHLIKLLEDFAFMYGDPPMVLVLAGGLGLPFRSALRLFGIGRVCPFEGKDITGNQLYLKWIQLFFPCDHAFFRNPFSDGPEDIFDPGTMNVVVVG
jgi:hypothetical protein